MTRIYAGKEMLMDYRATFGSDAGKRVLRKLMADYWVFLPIVESQQYHEGQRSVVLEIMRILDMRPQDLLEHRKSTLVQYGFRAEGEE